MQEGEGCIAAGHHQRPSGGKQALALLGRTADRLKAVRSAELRRSADRLQRLHEYRRDEDEALQPILRRLMAIERALRLREKIEAGDSRLER